MTKPRVYIAGPMTGYPNWNFPAFDAAAEYAMDKGYTAISPAEMDCIFEGWEWFPPEGLSFSHQDRVRFIRRDLNVILDLDPTCDWVLALPGWEQSRGANAEIALAQFLGIRVGYGALPNV